MSSSEASPLAQQQARPIPESHVYLPPLSPGTAIREYLSTEPPLGTSQVTPAPAHLPMLGVDPAVHHLTVEKNLTFSLDTFSADQLQEDQTNIQDARVQQHADGKPQPHSWPSRKPLPGTLEPNAVLLARSQDLTQYSAAPGSTLDSLGARDAAVSLEWLPSAADRHETPHNTPHNWRKEVPPLLRTIHQRNILATRGKPFNFCCPSGMLPTLSSWPLPSDMAVATSQATAGASDITRQMNFRRRFAGLPGVAPLPVPHIDGKRRPAHHNHARLRDGDGMHKTSPTAATAPKFQQLRSVALMLAIRKPGANH